jgi:Tfp pilus assembly protein PilX
MSTAAALNRRPGEQGIAIVFALFMMLAMTVLGTSLMFVSKTETLSSHNYRLMSQARYGAESGIHVAANYLMSADYAARMPGSAYDPSNGETGVGVTFTNYVITSTPVTFGGNPVVLSSTATDSNYPDSQVKTAFETLFQNASLDVADAPVHYKATATLRSMRVIKDAMTSLPVVIQTWEIVGEGSVSGARDATVEVSAVVERQVTPIYAYAAFSTDPNCQSMTFGGGGKTDSFDSRSSATEADGRPLTSDSGGDVGTNGNLTAGGSNNTVINGSLSTPRTGVGACTTSNVTAETISGQATVTSGLVQLSQSLEFPTPPLPSPQPVPGTQVKFPQDCPGMTGVCSSTSLPAGTMTLAEGGDGPWPTLDAAGGTLTLSDVQTTSNNTLILRRGTYNINSLTMSGQSRIVVYPGEAVTINVLGQDPSGGTMPTPITIVGGGLANTSYDPRNLRINYAGTGEVKLAGGEKMSALIYAPNATGRFTGGADLYGSVVVKTLADLGGAEIHYDRSLKLDELTARNYMMSAFTWKNY